MMNELLAAADKVTVPQAIDIAFNPGVYRAERWQARIKEAWSRARDSARSGDAAEVVRADRRLGPPLRRRLRPGPWPTTPSSGRSARTWASKVEPPAGLEDEPILEALRRGAAWLRSQLRLGRGPLRPLLPRGPRGGRSVLAGRRRHAARTRGWPRRAPSASRPSPDGKSMIGHGGQTSTQVIIMTDPPQSYAVIPLGESDHKDSGHWDDQAEKLFSKAQAAPTLLPRRARAARARDEHEGPPTRAGPSGRSVRRALGRAAPIVQFAGN